MGDHRTAAARGGLALAVLLTAAGCTDPEPPARAAGPTPSPSVAPCPPPDSVLLRAASGHAPPSGIRITDKKCVHDYLVATFRSEMTDPATVLFRRVGGEYRFLVLGTWLCDGPEVTQAPPGVRTAVGC